MSLSELRKIHRKFHYNGPALDQWRSIATNISKEETMCKVHNKYHNTAPKEAVYIGRGSQYGNPFIIGKDGNRDKVCDKFEAMVESDPLLKANICSNLKGKDLVCFCTPKRCHGDYLLRIANEERNEDGII